MLPLLLSAALLLWLAGSNQAIFLTLHHELQVLPGVFWRLASIPGEPIFAVAVLLALSLVRRDGSVAEILLAVLAILASVLLKDWFDVLRPPLALPAGSVNLLDVLPVNESFPSGHAIFSAVMLAAVAKHYPNLRYLASGWLWMVLLSRVAIGVHWPLDVLAGGALGLSLALMVYRKKWQPLATRMQARLAVGFAVILAGWLLVKLRSGVPNEAYMLFCVAVAAMIAMLGLAGTRWAKPANQN